MSGVLLHINDISGGPTPSASALEAAARATLATGLVSGVPVEDAEISITLAPADRIRELNRDYHGVDAATDVLAFPLGEGGRLLADVYVCPAAAAASAREHEITAEEEVLRLVIHGVLHLLGHDHPDGRVRYASEMFQLQERLLEDLRGSP